MHHHSLLIVSFAALTLGGCRNRAQLDNPDVAAGYRGEDKNQYETDIVTGRKRQNYASQGTSIAPRTLANIEDTITNVYEKDFERCLEREMGELDTRFLRAVFTVEFTIDTTGQAAKAKILKIQTRKQNAKGSDLGEVPSGGMETCISASIDEWVFEPPPEAVYVHTYNGQVGEAF
jgi:hypothetical protein